MKIGVVGRGHVGRAVHRLFDPSYDVVSWDIVDDCDLPVESFAACEVVFLAIGTPPDERGALDITGIAGLIEALPNRRFILKSTVPPGTTDALAEKYDRDICYWPEYIGQSRYHNPYFPDDIAQVPFVILGGSPEVTGWCLDFLQARLGPTKQYFRCRAVEAEMISFAENSYFATKVTFVNELKRICDVAGADWRTVREGWLLDPRIERMHTLVFPDAPGFSGACLPKDLSGLIHAAVEAGYAPSFLEAVRRSNDGFHEGCDGSAEATR